MPDEELEATLARVRAEAATAWPQLRVPGAAFDEHVAALAARDDAPPGQLRGRELYFAFACAASDPAALAVLESDYLLELRPVLGRMGLAPADVDDTLQIMHDELLTARAGAPARILTYAGRGSLRGWLRAVAARIGLRVRRPSSRNLPVELAETAPVGDHADADLQLTEKQYGDAFRAAFAIAIAELPAKDRLMLKQRFRHRLTIDELGRQHGIDAATMARWIEAARDRLAADTRAEMVRQLGIAPADISSIIRLIHSQLEVSLSMLSTAPLDAR